MDKRNHPSEKQKPKNYLLPNQVRNSTTEFVLSSLYMLAPRIKISVNTDISVIGFYGNIGNIGKISVDIFTHISVIKIFHILII